MKLFLMILTTTLSLGSILALHLSFESFLFMPLYALGAYHLFRVNFGEAFFLTFHEKKEEKTDRVKMRLGPGEFDLKGDAEKNEDKFIEIFDWKKVIVRQFLSWGLFAGAIYLFFYQLHMEITLASVMPAISFLFIMRTVSIGHLLVPLGINVVTLLLIMSEFSRNETVLVVVYGILFIVTLALIHPTEDRISSKIKEWKSGRWMEIVRTIGIILITFTAAKFFIGDQSVLDKEPLPKSELIRTQRKLNRMNSSLRRMATEGLFQNKDLLDRSMELSEKFKGATPGNWEALKNEFQQLEQDYLTGPAEGGTPELTPELLSRIKNDLNSRTRNERMNDLLKKAENFQGLGGKDIVSEYQELKFGKGGYYREETEFDITPVDGDSTTHLKNLKKSLEKKKEITERLNRNIEEVKESPDEALNAVNRALKEELEKVDSLSTAERESFKKEIARAGEVTNNLMSRTRDPELREKLDKLQFERNQLAGQITPHMNALAKSELAGKILTHQKKMESAGREVKDQITSRLETRELKEEKIPEKEQKNDFWKKIFRMGTLALGALLVLWFLRLLNKKGIKKVEGIPDEVKEELIDNLRALKKRNLSPRDEVIETYNVFHNALSTLVFQKETPPSCIVYEGMSVAEPELKDSTFTVTETFACTLYGGRDVTGADLKAFRREMNKIFSFFGIQI